MAIHKISILYQYNYFGFEEEYIAQFTVMLKVGISDNFYTAKGLYLPGKLDVSILSLNTTPPQGSVIFPGNPKQLSIPGKYPPCLIQVL